MDDSIFEHEMNTLSITEIYLKFVSAVFYQIFIFHQMIALQKAIALEVV